MTAAAARANEPAVEAVRRTTRGTIAEGSAVAIALLLGIGLVALAPDPRVSVLVVASVTGAIVGWIAWHDLRTFTIPDGAVLAFAILALVSRCMEIGADAIAGSPGSVAATLFVDAAFPAGLLFAFREIHYRRRGFDGLGLGDVKLAVAGGLFVGVLDFSWALFAASLAGLAIVAARMLVTRTKPETTDRLAFGALLAPALWALWIARHLPILAPFAGG